MPTTVWEYSRADDAKNGLMKAWMLGYQAWRYIQTYESSNSRKVCWVDLFDSVSAVLHTLIRGLNFCKNCIDFPHRKLDFRLVICLNKPKAFQLLLSQLTQSLSYLLISWVSESGKYILHKLLAAILDVCTIDQLAYCHDYATEHHDNRKTLPLPFRPESRKFKLELFNRPRTGRTWCYCTGSFDCDTCIHLLPGQAVRKIMFVSNSPADRRSCDESSAQR